VRFTVLPDGTQVLIRPIRPSDKALLAEGFSHLSPASAYARFLAPKPRLTTSDLRYLTEVDGIDHVALVAVTASYPRELVAVGRWVREAEHPDTAEVGITVGDCHQGQGLGRTLGLALAEEARMRGIRRFSATMLPGNTAAFRLFDAISAHLEHHLHDGVRELVADLAA
jgi:RimJ/RimL family protein N-acetyltransferase